MPYYMGIDIGSGTSKGVIIHDSELIFSCLIPSGINYRLAADKVAQKLLNISGLSMDNIKYIVSTGQGASSVTFSHQCISEMRCCARGVHYLLPQARTIIDVEGQTTQVFRLGEGGQIANFLATEKCASGSGRFLDIISNVLQVPLEQIGPLSLKSRNPVTFTTACAVFGESEAVSRVAEGTPVEDILAGVHQSMAEKISTMVENIGMEKECAMCGGGGLNTGLIHSLELALKVRLLVPPQPQLITAFGAALSGKETGKDSG